MPAGQGQIRVTKVRPNIYMLTGAGSNITVMPFDLGAVVVDTGTTAMADKVLETITAALAEADRQHHQHERNGGPCWRQRKAAQRRTAAAIRDCCR